MDQMSTQELIQAATLIVSLAAKAAMIHQIQVNYHRKSCKGISVPFYLIGLLSYLTRMIDGLTGAGWALAWGESPGVILCVVIAWQSVTYRRNG